MSKEHSETIFDHDVTDQEIKTLFNNPGGYKTVAEYKKNTEELYSGFTGDFVRLMELYELFDYRGLKDKAEEYRNKAHQTEYWKLRSKNPRRS